MTRQLRFGSALSLVAAATLISGCASSPFHHVRSASAADGKVNSQVGLATRAMAALNSNNVPAAIDWAEKAVANKPGDAGFRALLGSAYFAGGRFKSAEAAYKDSLAINSMQPQVVLKLALVEIGLGKTNEALGYLEAGRGVLDPADYGLALALAGHPTEAIQVLENVARSPSADSRVRQNLALALALAGDWTNARAVAAQDVPADQLDARIQDWMRLAEPGHGSAAVASLIGVTPAAVDPGQPIQLALNKAEAQMAAAAPIAPPVPTPAPLVEQNVSMTEAAPVAAEPAALPPAVEVAAAPPEAVPYVEVSHRELRSVSKAVAVRKSAAARPASKPTRMARASGRSSTVVQLGSYSNQKNVLAAWNSAARRYRALQAYAPMSARFASDNGTVYRLSVKGFGSANEAMALCSSLRRSGGSCFVRSFAGDVPVQIASNS